MSSSAPSTPRIAELPELVRNQIAAGEVVERPASVVKELVENALDAGATEVRVDLEEGGVRLVRVVDDGCGMAPEDLALAFRPHATSKLREVADLDHIGSLGFRGEALASIGSVARARILSRRHGAPTGASVEDVGGEIGPVVEAGGAQGTTIEVRDLFYNTPARRRFLKRPATELGRCLDILQRMAVGHLGVGFVVTHDKKRVFDVEAGMDLRGRVRRIFGTDLAEALVPVEANDGDTRLVGLLAPPRFARTDLSRQMWFLNGRPLRDKILIRCAKQAYQGFLIEGRHPVGFLSLSMDPGLVDVNVHPTKAEVRFREERRMFGFLVAKLREAATRLDMSTPGERLLDTAWRRGTREAHGQAHLPDPGPSRARSGDGGGLASYELPRADAPASGSAAERAPTVSEGPASLREGAAAWAARDELAGPFLQIDRTYLVRALPDGFEIVDQHALHERITFEGLKQALRAGRVETQRNLVPELVELSRAEVELLQEHLEALSRIGIELAVFGPGTIAVHGLPALLRRPNGEAVVHDVVALLQKAGRTPDVEDVLESVLHSMACRSSIMAGDELAQEDIRALLSQGKGLESDQTCVHARPTRVRFTLADLEKAFHRR